MITHFIEHITETSKTIFQDFIFWTTKSLTEANPALINFRVVSSNRADIKF